MAVRLAITVGDIAGVGPEVTLRALARFTDLDPLLVGPANLVRLAASRFGLDLGRAELADTGELPAELLFAGRDDARAGEASHRAVEQGVALAKEGKVAALVTAPISKAAWKLAGFSDPGHTELIERLTGRRSVMAFSGREPDGSTLRVALATIHEPLAAVPALVTRGELESILTIVHTALVDAFGLPDPLIGVCGLNPHAGESGNIGSEEEAVLKPLLADLRRRGMRLEGPHPADAIFTPRLRRRFDLILAMYHDQGLGPFKALTCNAGVNVTLGSGIIRTSPDHGTAFPIAGKGRAEEGSMVEAIRLALELAGRRI